MQTKISNNASSSVTAHAYRDGNGNSTLLIDSDTRDELVCNYSCKYDCEKVDYDTNNRVDWAWYKILKAKISSMELEKNSMA